MIKDKQIGIYLKNKKEKKNWFLIVVNDARRKLNFLKFIKFMEFKIFGKSEWKNFKFIHLLFNLLLN